MTVLGMMHEPGIDSLTLHDFSEQLIQKHGIIPMKASVVIFYDTYDGMTNRRC